MTRRAAASTASHGAPTRAAVDAFHAAALAHGGVDEGPSGPRPHYGERYYAAFVRDGKTLSTAASTG